MYTQLEPGDVVSTSTTASSSVPGTTSTSTSTNPASSTKTDGVSPKVIGGSVAGGVVVLLLLLLVLFLCLRQRNKTTRIKNIKNSKTYIDGTTVALTSDTSPRAVEVHLGLQNSTPWRPDSEEAVNLAPGPTSDHDHEEPIHNNQYTTVVMNTNTPPSPVPYPTVMMPTNHKRTPSSPAAYIPFHGLIPPLGHGPTTYPGDKGNPRFTESVPTLRTSSSDQSISSSGGSAALLSRSSGGSGATLPMTTTRSTSIGTIREVDVNRIANTVVSIMMGTQGLPTMGLTTDTGSDESHMVIPPVPPPIYQENR